MFSCTIYKFEINVELNGIGTASIPERIDKVSFTNLNGKLHATTEVESRYKRKIAKSKIFNAIMVINEVIIKLGFIYKVKITTSENGYVIKRLFPHQYPYFTSKIFTFRYSINVDHGKLAEKMENLKPVMKPMLNKALAYYQASLESENPHIKTILLVSCISSLIKDEYQIRRDLPLNDLIMYLDKVRKMKGMKKKNFKKLIQEIYSLRSKPAHGNIDIKDKMKLDAIIPYYKRLNEIVNSYVEKFLDKYGADNDYQRKIDSAN